jgi:hypothetical protein
MNIISNERSIPKKEIKLSLVGSMLQLFFDKANPYRFLEPFISRVHFLNGKDLSQLDLEIIVRHFLHSWLNGGAFGIDLFVIETNTPTKFVGNLQFSEK